MTADPLADLRAAVEAASASVRGHASPPRSAPTLERPKREGFGDLSTNAAMLLAPVLGAPPRDIAGRLGQELEAQLGDAMDRHEVAGPGFLNLWLSDAWHRDALAAVVDAGDAFGGGGADPAERIQVEFVSANPTGPLTAANARGGAFGDSLARVLEFHGHTIQREFYVNDAGTQVLRLGQSIQARATGAPVPEGGYEGEYVGELVDPKTARTATPEDLARMGIEVLVQRIRETLAAYRVEFDEWFHESTLYSTGTRNGELLDEAVGVLSAAGHVYESEGATWLRTTALGDDKDRVLRRSSGEPTYFLSDIAHHLWKIRGGFDRLVNVLGADHHGYVARMRAAVEALGFPPDRAEMPIMQFVHLVEGGSRASMSKRRGEFVTLADLIAEIGVDAARYFMVSRSHDTTIDLDLDLARSESQDNPVFYVQYAHARASRILEKAEVTDVAVPEAPLPDTLHPSERSLVKKLCELPDEVALAAGRRAPHRIATYSLELAQELSAFYRDCKVIGTELEPFRLSLCVATRSTLARSLDLLGVRAPDSM